jgi:hypothetical protein
MIRVLLAAAVLLALAPGLPGQDADDFAVGVLRRDGVVIPFATFDGRWNTPWPAGVRGIDLPIALADIPKRWWGDLQPPTEMTAWADGVRLGTVRLERPSMMPIMCTPRIALKSDYKSKQPAPLLAQPFPKDGLVTTGRPPVQALPSVERGSADWTAAAVTILDAFNEAEERAARTFTDWRHPFARNARQRMTIELEALYRAPMDDEGWSAYYVEAVRRYPLEPEDEGCGLVTFTSGWVRISPKGQPLMDLSSRISYCDRKGVSYMLPLGLMTVDGKTYWIYQKSGFDAEWYVVARPTSRAIEIHAEYAAGACPPQ